MGWFYTPPVAWGTGFPFSFLSLFRLIRTFGRVENGFITPSPRYFFFSSANLRLGCAKEKLKAGALFSLPLFFFFPPIVYARTGCSRARFGISPPLLSSFLLRCPRPQDNQLNAAVSPACAASFSLFFFFFFLFQQVRAS